MRTLSLVWFCVCLMTIVMLRDTNAGTKDGQLNARLMFECLLDGKRTSYVGLELTLYRLNGDVSAHCKLVRFFEHTSFTGGRPVLRFTIFDDIKVDDIILSDGVDTNGCFEEATCTIDLRKGDVVRLAIENEKHNTLEYTGHAKGIGESNVTGKMKLYEIEWRQVEGITLPPGTLIYPL